MPSRDPQIVVFKTTRIRRSDGKIITLMPGLKSNVVSDRIKSALPKEKLEELRKGGRVREEIPPSW